MDSLCDLGWCRQNAGPTVMGIINVTPDSFSDGGLFFDKDSAIAHGLELVAQGADILDIGGESTRPGAGTIGLDEELSRVIPVIDGIRARSDIRMSVDTSTPEVMEAAVKAGAGLINDVRALTRPGALEAAASCKVPVCLMHMQGSPDNMQLDPRYTDVVEEVYGFFKSRMDIAIGAGIARNNIILDPGFGFGKTLDHNLALLRHLDRFSDLGPVLAGLSRKSLIVRILGYEPVERRSASITLALLAAQKGASILRVHDVRETIEALRMWQAVNLPREEV